MIEQMHLEIAKERFLEMMAQDPGRNAANAAALAIAHADHFRDAYKAIAGDYAPAGDQKMKGCPACFGSGGKRDNRCKVCKGTGKIAA